MALRVLLVRHGESVDNVAGLYAGSRDSPLTSHGVLQAQRLGIHLAARSHTIGPVAHVFTSNLRRAVKTADAVAEAQSRVDGVHSPPEVVQLPMLREKDFGSDEGMRFGSRGGAQKTGPSSAAARVEPESQQSMKARVDIFVDQHFVPTAARAAADARPAAIAIVAHGIILNVLLRTLLTRFGPEEMARLAKPGDAPWRSEWLAAWSNTGYLELELRVATPVAVSDPAVFGTSTHQAQPASDREHAPDLSNIESAVVPVASLEEITVIEETDRVSAPPATPSGEAAAPMVPDIQLFVKAVNSVEHLQGLKKTRGGIGSAGFDEKQRTVDSFFARPAKKSKPDTA